MIESEEYCGLLIVPTCYLLTPAMLASVKKKLERHSQLKKKSSHDLKLIPLWAFIRKPKATSSQREDFLAITVDICFFPLYHPFPRKHSKMCIKRADGNPAGEKKMHILSVLSAFQIAEPCLSKHA